MAENSVEQDVKVSVDKLKIGMYVAQLDRPWEESPFMVQGMWIESPEDINRLKRACRYVYVNRKLSTEFVALESLSLNEHGEETSLDDISRRVDASGVPQAADWVPRPKKRAAAEKTVATVRYTDEVSVARELSEARVAVADLEASVAFAIESIGREEAINFRAVTSAVLELARSLARNPDAAIGLAIGRRQEPYTLRHCVNMAIWSMALGRQAGLPVEELKTLGIGATLCDLGREKLPRELLDRPGKLSHWELGVIREHVAFTLNMLESDRQLDPAVLTMVAQHHEQPDGSGYPQKLSGGRIDLYARIARIADCFEAMITHGPHREALPTSKAMKELYALRGSHFQKGLVEAFIAAIGIYPAGTSVRLNSGEAGIVVDGSRARHLKPVVWRMLDADGHAFGRPGALDLSDDPSHRQIVADYPDGDLGISARAFFC